MTIPATAIPSKYNILLLLALIAAGLTGNYFKYPIFLNIDFLFGSIFAMLALQFFGLGRGIVAAAAIAGYTYVLWNHPYAIIIMTAEVTVVGWLMTRRKISMVVADSIYWLIIGMPLVYLFYHLVMHASLSSVTITMTKQAMNGIANALVARLIFTAVMFCSRSQLISLREIISNLFVLFIMLQSLLMLAITSRTDFTETDRNIRNNLKHTSQRLDHYVATWLNTRKATIINLAEMAATRSPQQMQSYLEFAKKSNVSFPRVGLLDSTATVTAYAPLVDEAGKSNIGISAADRPYLAQLKQSLKPMLSEVVMGKIGTPKPKVFMLAPVIISGEFGGYVVGVMDLEQIREQLDKSLAENATFYTLLDKNGNIIMTNRTDQKVMTPIDRGKGAFKRLDKDVSQWVPTLPPNTPISERWKKSFYVAETSLGDLAEWKLILEQPVAPFQKKLYDSYTKKLMMLFLILLFVMTLAEFLSRQAMVAMEKLRLITIGLPDKLASDDKKIVWPDSSIKETNHLVSNFMEMAEKMAEQRASLLQSKNELEILVEERTAELRGSENTLLKSEQLLLTAQAIGKTGAWIYSIEKQKIWGSSEGLRIFGYPPVAGEFSIDDIEACIPERDRVNQALVDLISEGKEYNIEYVINPADGSPPKVIRSIAQLEKDSEGNPLHVIGFIQDITEQKSLEVALQENRSFLSEVIENSGAAIYVKDCEGRHELVNRKWEEIAKTKRDVALGKTDIEIFPAIVGEAFRKIDVLVIESDHVIETEEVIEDATGKRYFLSVKIPLKGGDNKIKGICGISTEITGRKQIEEQLLIAKEAAESANTAKSQFLANMSHEIRTPMNGVLGMTQLLELTELTPEQREYVEALKLSGKNLLSIISDILDLSKIEAGKIMLELTEFSLHQSINDVVLMQKTVAYEKRLALELNLTRDIPPLLVGDQLRIKQILLNLLGNAIKFTSQGSVAISTQLLERHDNFVLIQIAVRDSGIGISPESLDAIFKPFTQEDGSTTRKFGGTGLGLTISLRLAELMGGTISVESTPGSGSCFTLTLPFTVGRAIVTTQTATPQTAIGWDGPPLRILFVEDDQTNIKFGSILLNKMGLDVTVSENGRECLTALEQSTFDLVLMDIQMPLMNGEEALKEIRSKEQGTTDHLPVIALTAYSMRGDKERFMEEGFDGYVSKPLITRELVAEMKRVMGLSCETMEETSE